MEDGMFCCVNELILICFVDLVNAFSVWTVITRIVEIMGFQILIQYYVCNAWQYLWITTTCFVKPIYEYCIGFLRKTILRLHVLLELVLVVIVSIDTIVIGQMLCN